MVDRNQYLDDLQRQLKDWADLVRKWEQEGRSSAEQLRSEAQAEYERRAAQLKSIIDDGRVQVERVSTATEDMWRDMADNAEQVWQTLQASVRELRERAEAVLARPAPRKVARKKAAVKKAAKKKAAKKKASRKKATRKKAAGKKAAGKKAARKKTAKKKSSARSARSARRSARRKPAAKKKTAGKKRSKSGRKKGPARKK